jgi:hypothetical protein
VSREGRKTDWFLGYFTVLLQAQNLHSIQQQRRMFINSNYVNILKETAAVLFKGNYPGTCLKKLGKGIKYVT